jgi:hypothetical protein
LAVTEKFLDYLNGQTFSVNTDNNPLTYILTSAKLDAIGHRWVAAISAYQFTITFKHGKTNTDANALSRLQGTIDSDTVKAICNLEQGYPLIETLPVQPASCHLIQPSATNSTQFQRLDLRAIQQQDTKILGWLIMY